MLLHNNLRKKHNILYCIISKILDIFKQFIIFVLLMKSILNQKKYILGLIIIWNCTLKIFFKSSQNQNISKYFF